MTENKSEIDFRATFAESKWRQGVLVSFVEVKNAIQYATFDYQNKNSKKFYLLVITQDCDILHGKIGEEPHIVCLFCEKIKQDKFLEDLSNGWNPRKLHFAVDGECFELAAKNVCYLDKLKLLECSLEPQELKLSDDQLKKAKKFKANRYVRTGFPEKFEDLTRNIFQKDETIKLLSALAQDVETIYLRVKHLDEKEGNFSLGLIALLKNSVDSEPLRSKIEIRDLLNEQLLYPLSKIDGIELENEFEIELNGEVIEYLGKWEGLYIETVMYKQDFFIELEDSFQPYYYDPISLESM